MPKDGIDISSAASSASIDRRDPQLRRSVAIVQRVVADYNVPLFNGLHRELEQNGVAFRVFAGDDGGRQMLKDSISDVACAVRVPNIRFGSKLYWQPILSKLWHFDLVIVEQANASLINYPLILGKRLHPATRVAYWGHGRTMSPRDSGPIRAQLKRSMAGLADHFFAYTELSRKLLTEAGYPADRITVINNGLDTSLNQSARLAMTKERRHRIQAAFGITEGPLAIFCARLLQEREFPFILEACRLARARIPDLQLALIGDGDQHGWLTRETRNMPWVRLCGALYGQQKAELMASGDVFVMPAYVGLSILDAFSTGLPVISSRFPGHGPEIEYLTHGENGFMTSTEPEAFSDAILATLGDSTRRKAMAQSAIETAEKYNMGSTVRLFSEGIGRVLSDCRP